MIFNTMLSGGIDTSDATATASKIFNGETAYVNGEKITGTALATATTAITSNIEKGKTAYNNNGELITGTKNILMPYESKSFVMKEPGWSFSYNNGGQDYAGLYQGGVVSPSTEIQNYVSGKTFIIQPLSINIKNFYYNNKLVSYNTYFNITSENPPSSTPNLITAFVKVIKPYKDSFYFQVILDSTRKLSYCPYTGDGGVHTSFTRFGVKVYLFDDTVYHSI